MKKDIYIVEDNTDVGEIIEFLLIDYGFQVSLFTSASDFEINIENPLPALIIMDVMLPDGDGIDICRRLKLDDRTKHIPILVMSANEGNKDRAIVNHADGFLSKPFDIDDLLTRVQKYVA